MKFYQFQCALAYINLSNDFTASEIIPCTVYTKKSYRLNQYFRVFCFKFSKYFLSHALVVIILQQFTMEILQNSNVNQTLRNFIIDVIYVFVDDIENAYTCSVLNINEILRLKWNMNDSYDFFFPFSCESTFTLEIVITINLNIQFRMMKFFRNHSIYYSCHKSLLLAYLH